MVKLWHAYKNFVIYAIFKIYSVKFGKFNGMGKLIGWPHIKEQHLKKKT